MDKVLFSYNGVKLHLVKLSILTVFQSVMIIIQAYSLAEAISSLFGGDLFRQVVNSLLLFIIALIVRQLITGWKKTIAFQFAKKTSENLLDELMQKLFQLGPRFVRGEGSGQTITLVMEGMRRFRRYLELIFIKTMNMALIPVTILLVIFYLNIRSAVILGLAVPILIAFMILLGYAAKSKADQQYESYHLLSNHFVDSLRGLETLKYLGLSKQHIDQISLVSERYRRSTMATLKLAFLSSFAMDFFTMLSIATVAVFLGMGLINGTMELFPALTILILAPEYFLPIRELGADYHATLDGKNAGKKMEEIIAKESIVQLQVRVPIWDSTSRLAIKDLNVMFPESNQEGLQNINFSIAGVKKIGIIGASGAGKSTLIDVLGGFIPPTSGEIQLGDQKITSLSVLDWQRQVSYIPQHPYIFNDTLFNNIRFYHPNANMEEVFEAVKSAGLLEVMQDLPKGLDTIIGDGGQALSGGQEQRIALARAFIGNRPIILLDEPTAHLDIETEDELKETMLRLFDKKLVFFATHRLHWMLNMDQILVLNHGHLVERGTHIQLMEQKGTYRQLVQQQMGGIS
ncbi:thiol reductant ABC exporter subunit CydD [Neobacillus jeddahensis]|uniref:thiol reductant ABC exporter subunit CydD n=1 Tax=Neobacillus jeddahensis TaxID=1461580 RepID=UPI000590BBFD|nr:thiol reductant ABC exporter subunit CydD [Neobacillus jeddahensis]